MPKHRIRLATALAGTTTLSLCYYSQITRVQFLWANDAVVDDGEDAASESIAGDALPAFHPEFAKPTVTVVNDGRALGWGAGGAALLHSAKLRSSPVQGNAAVTMTVRS